MRRCGAGDVAPLAQRVAHGQGDDALCGYVDGSEGRGDAFVCVQEGPDVGSGALRRGAAQSELVGALGDGRTASTT